MIIPGGLPYATPGAVIPKPVVTPVTQTPMNIPIATPGAVRPTGGAKPSYPSTAVSDAEKFTYGLKYKSGGGTAVAGGGVDNAQATIITQGTGAVDPKTGLREGGQRLTLVNPYTNQPVYYGSPQSDWNAVYAYYKEKGELPLTQPSGASGGGGGGGGYGGGGGGGGGGATYYPQFDYNQAQGLWNTYITNEGFGGQNRRGDWGRDFYNQSLLDFNSDWTTKHQPKEIPKEGTTDAPDIAQTSDYNKYLKKNFGGETLDNVYADLSMDRRGDNAARFTGGSRVIGWG